MDATTQYNHLNTQKNITNLRQASVKLTLLKNLPAKTRTATHEWEINNLTNEITETLPKLLPIMANYYLGDYEVTPEWENRITEWENLLNDAGLQAPNMDNPNIGLDMLNELFTKVQNALITLDGVAQEIAKYSEAYRKSYERYEAVIKMAVPDLKVDSSNALATASLPDEVITVETSLTVLTKLYSNRKQTLLAVKQTLTEIAQNHRQAVPWPTGIDPLLGRGDRKV